MYALEPELRNAYLAAKRTGYLELSVKIGYPSPFPPLPPFPNIMHLVLEGLDLETLPELPQTLTSITIKARLKKLPALPESLGYLAITSEVLEELPPLPANLKGLVCREALFSKFPPLPAGLVLFTCERMKNLTELPALPPTLKGLFCRCTNITELPRLPVGIRNVLPTFNNFNDEFQRIEAMNFRIYETEEEVLEDLYPNIFTQDQIAEVNAYHDRQEARAEARACGRDIISLMSTISRRVDVPEELSAHMGSFLSGLLTRMDVQRAFLQLKAQ
jgi:hypothetical protein